MGPDQDKLNPDLNGPYLPVVFGSVSSYWREVVQSTPSIWSTLVVEIRERTAKSHASLLQLYLRRCQPLRLGIELDFRRVGLDTEQFSKDSSNHTRLVNHIRDVLYPVADALFRAENVGRISHLRLMAPPYEWLSLLSKAPPQVELCLGWTPVTSLDTSPLIISPSIFPGLQTLHIVSFPQFSIPSTFPSIIQLDLTRVPVGLCFDVLSSCPNLEECRLRHLTTAAKRHIAPSFTPITLTRLRDLEWTLPMYDSTTPAVPVYILTPTLRRIKWDAHNDNAEKVSEFIKFFSHAPQSMETIHLSGDLVKTTPEEALFDTFTSASQLRYIYLEEQRDLLKVLPFIQVLAEGFSESPSVFLPQLDTIKFIFNQGIVDGLRRPRVLGFIIELITLLVVRHEANQDAPLTLDFNVNFEWPEEGGGLKEVVEVYSTAEKGLVLDIREKGRPIPWVEFVKKKAAEHGDEC